MEQAKADIERLEQEALQIPKSPTEEGETSTSSDSSKSDIDESSETKE